MSYLHSGWWSIFILHYTLQSVRCSLVLRSEHRSLFLSIFNAHNYSNTTHYKIWISFTQGRNRGYQELLPATRPCNLFVCLFVLVGCLHGIVKMSVFHLEVVDLPHKVKMQYLHFRSHSEYFLLSWKIPQVMSRRSILFHN